MIRMEDVTDKILSELNDEMTEEERNIKIKEFSDELTEMAIEDTYYKARVVDMFNNNQFFLFVHIIYKDVRFVGAPPSAMGKFGGDTDNWMWPRHTADFALLRIYTAPDGTPASYSEENIPLKPNYYLPVSTKGFKDNDFAMIMGFSGSTNRYLTSFGLAETMNIVNTLRHDIRTVKLDIIKEDMLKDDLVRIQYASKAARVSNYWKYSYEQNKALRRLNTMGIKKDIEKKFIRWASENPERQQKYGDALNIIEQVYNNRKELTEARMYMFEGLLTGAELPMFAYRNRNLLEALESKEQEKIDEAIENARQSAENFYKDYNPGTEKRLIAAMYKYVYENMDKKYHPEVFETIEKSYKNDFEAYAEDIINKSVFGTEEAFMSFLDRPRLRKLRNDPALNAGMSVFYSYREINEQFRELSKELPRGERLFVDGWLQINDDKFLYPDANSTIRITYGTVGGYEPRDGVVYDYYTTIEGVMEKKDQDCHEFYVPERLTELYNNKDFGDYINDKGELVTCFITNNDITGGNSGSPVIDAEGRLIGVAFDGNSEAMSGDIHFETVLQKCINVDARYVLFVIDKYANAQNIMRELNVVR